MANRTIMVCQEGIHSKYWIVEKDPANPAIVLVKNGRLGSPKGAVQPPRHNSSEYYAHRYIEDKIAEKRRKGYRKIDENSFKQLTIQSSVIGLNNKCYQLQWVENIGPIAGAINLMEVPEDRLMQPDYDPALLVALTTKKAYGGRNSFRFLFTPDKSYEVLKFTNHSFQTTTKSSTGKAYQCDLREITAGDPLYEISSKVEAGMATVFN